MKNDQINIAEIRKAAELQLKVVKNDGFMSTVIIRNQAEDIIALCDAIDRLREEASGSGGIPPGHVEIVTNGTRRVIPEDEPVFLLRGRDPFAASAVEHWAAIAERGGVRSGQIRIAIDHADKMRQWPVKKLPGSTRLAEEG